MYRKCQILPTISKSYQIKFLLLLFLILFSCSTKTKTVSTQEKHNNDIIDTLPKAAIIKKDTSILEKKIIEAGLINIHELDSSIMVELRYSTTNNFLGTDLYGTFNSCYLQPDVAKKLVNAQKYLRQEYPKYKLVVFDATRPRSVQKMMWDKLTIPDHEKGKFVSNPKYGSLHNFGAAVDLSILDENNYELDMGTPYDYLGELAYPTKEKQLLKEGRLTPTQVNNRKLLRKVMHKAGFFNIQTEWWHFNSCYRNEARQKYIIIE